MSARRVMPGKRKYTSKEVEDGDDNKVVGSSRSAALVERIKGMEFNLQQLRKREYCDVTLRTTSVKPSGLGSLAEFQQHQQQEPIYGHKIVLKSASPYFEALLTSDEPAQKQDFFVNGIDRSTLNFLLDCIYNCNVGPIDGDNVFEVCAGAKLLQLPAIEDACEVSIENSKTISNCLKIWTFGRQQDCRRLGDSKFILKNFAAVAKTERFLSLTPEEIEALISSSSNKQKDELSANDLLLSLHKWVCADFSKRIKAFLTLVRSLSRDELDEHIFAQVFINDKQFKEDSECQKFRDEYLCDFFRRHIQQKTNGSAPTPPAKRERTATAKVMAAATPPPTKAKLKEVKEVKEDKVEEPPVVLGRRGRGRPTVVQPDKNSSSPSRASSSSEGHGRSISTPAQKRLKKSERSLVPFTFTVDDSNCVAYYISHKGNDWVIMSYDFQTGENKRVGNFLHYRENGALLVVNKTIYFLGGKVSHGGPGATGDDSNKIDTLNIEPGEWNCGGDLMEMDEGRSFFNCAVMNNNIYIVAGYREDSCIDSVERIPLNPPISRGLGHIEDEVTNVKWAKNRAPVAVLNGKLYSVGGVVAEANSNAWASDFVECYDPKTNKWTNVSRMGTARVGHAVAVLNNKLYAIGGGKSEEPHDSLKLATVEAFDPDTNSWSFVCSMHKKRQFGSAVAHGGYILAIAGDSEKTPTAEKFDPVEDSWELLGTGFLPTDADYTSMIFKVIPDEITIE